ncbi:hypothetical protein EPUL_001672 [Erysiphe pulchra]|uniref:DUF8035 domain-containing protein n=1 Tax=Erysiphe pulchra TaxID=225359 RepID=A0A2S4PW26_9PEZI|nr:hypothetical protein EPUL_001672 [Erysiphe pulchra]
MSPDRTRLSDLAGSKPKTLTILSVISVRLFVRIVSSIAVFYNNKTNTVNVAGPQNVISQIGSLLNSLSHGDPSVSRRSNSTHGKHREYDHTKKRENQKSEYSDKMVRDQQHPSSQTYPQRSDAERFFKEQEYNRHHIREEQPIPFKRSTSQVRARQHSVAEEKHRGLPLPVQDQSHYRRRQTISSQQPYLTRDNFTPKDYEQRRKFYSPSPPRREIPVRPSALRRQSSLDTFDRKPRALNENGQQFISPIRNRSSLLPASVPIPLPFRHLPPSGAYNNRYYHNFDGTERNPTRGQSPSKFSEFNDGRDHSKQRGRGTSKEVDRNHIPNYYSRNSSTDSSWSSGSDSSTQSEFPKRGKTKIPEKLVHKHAIVDLGYPFEEEGNLIIILKALGRKNLDELIKLSERYKADEKVKIEATSKEHTNIYTVAYPSQQNNPVIDFPQIPPPPVPISIPPPAGVPTATFFPVSPASNSTATATFHNPVGGMPRTSDGTQSFAQALHIKDERAISAEIKALEAEREALLSQRRADQLRREGQGIVVLREERERDGCREEVTVIRREGKNPAREEKSPSRNRRPRIVKDRKGRKSIAVPRNLR